jgi:hypothetical protein
MTAAVLMTTSCCPLSLHKTRGTRSTGKYAGGQQATSCGQPKKLSLFDGHLSSAVALRAVFIKDAAPKAIEQ